MSVLIRGMDMPENCCQCEWHEYYGGDYDWCHACRKTGTMPIENAEIGRAEDCPLVELPPKHGRLIDEDAVIDAIHERLHVLQTHSEFRKKHGDIDLLGVIPYIAKIQSVIEAEGE